MRTETKENMTLWYEWLLKWNALGIFRCLTRPNSLDKLYTCSVFKPALPAIQLCSTLFSPYYIIILIKRRHFHLSSFTLFYRGVWIFEKEITKHNFSLHIQLCKTGTSVVILTYYFTVWKKHNFAYITIYIILKHFSGLYLICITQSELIIPT